MALKNICTENVNSFVYTSLVSLANYNLRVYIYVAKGVHPNISDTYSVCKTFQAFSVYRTTDESSYNYVYMYIFANYL